LKLLTDPSGVAMLQENLTTLLIGNVIAFVVALGAIKFFISFLTRYGFKAFGYYRIVIGGILLALIFSGIELSIL
jgi:undecaprenyl-diphosphatase